ncbi:hypothetical protein AB5J72_00620 [Streptomyces sp. CG1]|uniref:hypothetical protein n=1 Tax=Streptomyces sp. CG1 TaxID=1287523 RepID=UPI0034E23851
MSLGDPAIDRLVEAARHAPAGLIARLLESGDLREVRLGQAIEDIRREHMHPTETSVDEGGRVIDPVTHDPAW